MGPCFNAYRFKSSEESLNKLQNIAVVAGWIPLVGVISGIVKMILAIVNLSLDAKNNSNQASEIKKISISYLVRGITEVATLGFIGILHIIPDLIFTIIHFTKVARIKKMEVYNLRDQITSVLGIDINSTPEEVRVNYRTKLLELHPDKCHQRKNESNEKFVQREIENRNKWDKLKEAHNSYLEMNDADKVCRLKHP